jgi:hypothetical protein
MSTTDNNAKTFLTQGGETLVDFTVNKDEDKQIQLLYSLSSKIDAAGENVAKVKTFIIKTK